MSDLCEVNVHQLVGDTVRIPKVRKAEHMLIKGTPMYIVHAFTHTRYVFPMSNIAYIELYDESI